MKIYYQPEKEFIDSGNSIEINKDDAGFIIMEIKKFIKGRLIVYSDEMNKYPEGCVVFKINPPQIEYHYPYEFGKRLSECITEEDFNHICTKIYGDLNRQ